VKKEKRKMYKLTYYSNTGSSQTSFKEFVTMNEAFDFLFKMPSGTLIELKYYDLNSTKKPDSN
jgi:hypothetical protein